jgi:NTE family protein
MLGICFQGCACRAAFYAGVVAALNEARVPIQITSGASSGAICAVAVAAGKSKELPDLWRRLADTSVVSWRRLFHNNSPFDMSYIVRKALLDSIESFDLRASPIEALVSATSSRTLKPKIFSSREEPSMLDPAMGSAFFPVLYGRPVQVRGEWLLDGGFTDNLPIEALAKRGATEVIAVVPSHEGIAFKDLSRRRWNPRLPGARLSVIYPREKLALRSWEFARDRMEATIEEGYYQGRKFAAERQALI